MHFQSNGAAVFSFSTFCSLKPKHVKLIGGSGTHNVCVCRYHQNVHLMLSAIKGSANKNMLMDLAVCSIENRDCMMRNCPKCPGMKPVRNEILNLVGDKDFVVYWQWQTVDRAEMKVFETPIEEFADKLANQVVELTSHHYTSRWQSKYLRQKIENLKETECIVLCDFAENYSSITQDAIQSAHWSSVQTALHTSVVYLKIDGKVIHENIVVVSDSLEKNSSSVYAFLDETIKFIQSKYPEISNVMYFTNGSAAQYKNRFNFANLCCHYRDKRLKASWHFFATSHGKSPCDGLGGTSKRLLRLASLQNPTKPINTPHDVYQWLDKNVKNIKYIFVGNDTVQIVKKNLSARFRSAIAIPSTQKYHSFEPLNEFQITVSMLSGDNSTQIVNVRMYMNFQIFKFYII